MSGLSSHKNGILAIIFNLVITITIVLLEDGIKAPLFANLGKGRGHASTSGTTVQKDLQNLPKILTIKKGPLLSS